MQQFLEKKLMLLLGLLFLFLTLLPILAPLFAYYGFKPGADSIYWLYQWICHQKPWRSYHLFDFQFGLDARMTFMFLSLSLGSFVVYFFKIKPLNYKAALLLMALFTVPLAIDGSIQLLAEVMSLANVSVLPFYESTNFMRSLTGAMWGSGTAIALGSVLSGASLEVGQNLKYGIQKSIMILIVAALFIPVITFISFSTSTRYKPASPLVDIARRFPGYNYEITFEGGHSTIKRAIIISPDRYIARAKAFNKQEYIDEYMRNKD